MLATLASSVLGQATEAIGQLYSDMSAYAPGWGALALINAGLAQGKNRRGLEWFGASVFLGPIATFLLVAFYDKLPPDTPAE